MDTAEQNVDFSGITDVEGRGLLETDSAREMLFDEILEQLAACDLFSNPAHAPTIFPVYAHQNDAVGASHEECVHKLIRWLQKIKARVLSDKSALPPLPSREGNTSAQGHILANQIRLLPTGKSPNPGETSTTIDKVIVCASDVLKGYCETGNAKDYMERIIRLCVRNNEQSIDWIEARIRQEIEGETSNNDFHHVLTELALLQVRVSRLSADHGMVPVGLNGAHSLGYLRLFESTDLVLKLESPTPPALHKLFFKLLGQLFVEEIDLVNACKKCYDDVVKELNLESGKSLSRKSFHICLSPKITKMYQSHWGVFSTAMRNGKYIAYAGKVGKHAFQIAENMKEQERLKILEWISPTGAAPMHGKYLDTNTKRSDGTCDWVIHHEAFLRWHTSQESAILSLSGSMGTGKTYTTSRVIDWIGSCLDESTYDEAFAYFYCIKQEGSRRSPTAILRSLVKQVASGPWNRREDNIDLDEAIIEIWNKHAKDKLYDIFDDWKNCLFKILSKYPRTTVVLDALDECTEKERQILVELFDELSARPSDESSIKIFVATRPESDLNEWLRCHHAIRMQDRKAEDIATFLRSKVEQHTRWSKSTHAFKEYVIDTLSKRSQDMFLYASLQIDVLLDCKLKNDIRDALNKLPEDLNAAYSDIYNAATKRLGEKSLIDKALQWVLCSVRPLTSSELLCAICQDSETDDILAPDEAEINEDLVLGLSHNFLRLDIPIDSHKEGPRVWRLAHQAVAEFFEKSASFSHREAHCEVGRVCLMILIKTLSGSNGESTNDEDYECPCRENLGPDKSTWSRAKHFSFGAKLFSFRAKHISFEAKHIPFEAKHIPFEETLVEYANYAWPTHVRAYEQLEARSIDGICQTLQEFLGEPNKGSLVYGRWAAHSFQAKTDRDPPAWSIFADRSMPSLLGPRPMMTPLSLACHLGLHTTLAAWWDSPSLDVNIRYSNKGFSPWEGHCWRLPNHGPLERPLKWSLMALACAHSETKILSRLLDRSAESHTLEQDEVPPIVAATIGDSAETVSELIKRTSDVRSTLAEWHEHILACAIKGNSLNAMGPLLKGLFSEPDEVENVLASITTMDFRSANAITMLLERGVDANAPLRDGTLLATAANNKWEELVRRLLTSGADVNKQFDEPEFESSLFHNALEASISSEDNLPVSRLLVEHGACVGARAVAILCEQYPYHRNPDETLEFLLRNMPDPNETWTNEDGESSCALVPMLDFGFVGHVHLLLKRGAVVNPWVGEEEVDTLNIVFEATLSKAYSYSTEVYPTGKMIEALTRAGATFERLKGDDRSRALVAAAQAGLKDTVRDLLKCGANPNALIEHRYPTALSAAAASEHPQAPDIIHVLLDGGAEINTYFPETIGETSLSGRLALDFPLWYILCETSPCEEPDADGLKSRDIWFRSASVLLERGAIWDIDFGQWRRCLESRGPEFALQNTEYLDSFQRYWTSNRTRDPRVASDECWKIKDPEARVGFERVVLYNIGRVLRNIEDQGAWD